MIGAIYNERNELQAAIEKLTRMGHAVQRADEPPPPFPGLYFVDGRELTEMQVISYARQAG